MMMISFKDIVVFIIPFGNFSINISMEMIEGYTSTLLLSIDIIKFLSFVCYLICFFSSHIISITKTVIIGSSNILVR